MKYCQRYCLLFFILVCSKGLNASQQLMLPDKSKDPSQKDQGQVQSCEQLGDLITHIAAPGMRWHGGPKLKANWKKLVKEAWKKDIPPHHKNIENAMAIVNGKLIEITQVEGLMGTFVNGLADLPERSYILVRPNPKGKLICGCFKDGCRPSNGDWWGSLD